MKTVIKVMYIFATLCLLGLMVIAGSYLYVEWCGRGRTYSNVERIPENRVGLLLGTSPVSRYTKRINPYYYNRIDAAVKLYKSGKIKRILASGDNRHPSYNEPDMMKADLIKAGIPAHHIYCDYAGFRTLDSVIRAQKVFGIHKFTVISQEFHNNRTIAIVRSHGIDAIGFNAKDLSRRKGWKVQVRELLARPIMILQMIINKQPHFLGNPIHVT